MVYRTRIKYTDEMKSYRWDRYQQGDSVWSIARSLDRSSSSIDGQLAQFGGFRPMDRTESSRSLTLEGREEISRGLIAFLSMHTIAAQLDGTPSSFSHAERKGHGQPCSLRSLSSQEL